MEINGVGIMLIGMAFLGQGLYLLLKTHSDRLEIDGGSSETPADAVPQRAWYRNITLSVKMRPFQKQRFDGWFCVVTGFVVAILGLYSIVSR